MMHLLPAEHASTSGNPRVEPLTAGSTSPLHHTAGAVDTASLYRGPLEDFVARRTALVHELRSSDKEAADAAGKLRKPPVSAWAIDQLAADHLALITGLLAAGADAREAQRNVAAGTETGDDLRLATGRLRDAVEAATRAAIDVLTQAGHTASDETGRRIRTSLQAAATGGAVERRLLWTGTLDRDIDGSGFGGVDESEDDDPGLAALLAPLRRQTHSMSSAPTSTRRSSSAERIAQREVERDIAKKDAAAEAARAFAQSARHQADRLAEEARVAAGKAADAEDAAAAAADAARAAHANADR